MDEIRESKETVINADIAKEMRASYLNYAMSVIVSRALPDARDGLKPVHRRILFDMDELGISSTGEFKKSARIVGDVLGKYHPHGDASVYDALVRLAQDFSLRYPVIYPHGNFGSVDGDPAAAMRYTEAKMSKIGEEMLVDIKKETVAMMDNYDGSMQEPTVLPAAFPYMMANGSSGIAVGMATNIAPHNLKEICAATCAAIDNPDISIEELMDYIPGPDFPTYGLICGKNGIRDAYETGRGKIVMRGRYHIEEHRDGRDVIVFTEIPYQVNKAELVKRIHELKKEEIKGISEVRDESSEKEGMRVVIELKSNAQVRVVVNQLFKHTELQSNFNVNNLALVNGRPQVLNLKDMLLCYIHHREDVITKRTKYDLRKAEERAHILLGLKIGLENIDKVIEIIKSSEDGATAAVNLMGAFGLTEIQAKAIIDMKLGRLAHLETEEILAELKEIEEKVAYFKKVLSDEKLLDSIVKDELCSIASKYGDARRTEILEPELGDSNIEDFIKQEDVIVTTTAKGFVKRVPVAEYRAQGKGGMGVKGATFRGEDKAVAIFMANTHDYVMFFTSFGRACWCKVYEIEDSSKVSKGSSIKSIIQLQEGEYITNVINFKSFDDGKQILMMTRRGVAKRAQLAAYRNARAKGVIAIELDEGDLLMNTVFVSDGDYAMVITKNGRGLKFCVDSVRIMGRTAHGVRGINLADDDEVVGLVKVDEAKKVLVVTEKGKGKQVEYDDFNAHGRGTGGQIIYKPSETTSYLVSALSVDENQDLVCITQLGQIIRMHVTDISTQGRAATGVIIFRLKKAMDSIVSIEAVPREEDSDIEVEDTEDTGTSEESSEEIVIEDEK